MTEIGRRRPWRAVEVLEIREESPAVRTLVLDAPQWPGHRPGQSVDVRLTAPGGYSTQRLVLDRLGARGPAARADGRAPRGRRGVALPGGRAARRRPLRDPRPPGGNSFSWHVEDGGPLLLIAGGAGLVPLRAMLRHRIALRAGVAASRVAASTPRC